MISWLPIKGFPEYEVSRWGTVRHRSTKREKVFTDNGNGYLRTNLFSRGKQTTVYLHRILAEAFIPNPLKLPQINHKDGNKTNNSLDNLEWCTGSANVQHKNYVLKRGNCKSVRCLETMIEYPSVSEAERETGCDHRHISDCCRNKRKTCGGFHWEYSERGADECTN